jgi:hypothetical protein
MGIVPALACSTSNNSFGHSVVSGYTYNYSFVLPTSLSALTDHAIPLGWCGSSSLYLE